MTSETIKRYTHGHANGVMTPATDGPSVRYCDHAEALATERAAREAAERDLELERSVIRSMALDGVNLQQRAESAESQLADLRRRCEGLVDSWRRIAHELRYNPAAMPRTAHHYEKCADELRALVADDAGEEG